MLIALLRKLRDSRVRRDERGQVLVLFVAIISIIFVAGAMAVDYGLWLSEKQGIVRAADLGALAATQNMPADPANNTPVTTRGACNAPSETIPPGDACEAAFDWAARNGYGEADGAFIKVSFFCGNTLSSTIVNAINNNNSSNKVCYNENQNQAPFYLSPCPTSGQAEKGCDAINVTITKPGAELFSTFFGIGATVDVGFGSWANVTFKLLPTDSAVIIDRSASMKDPPCSGANGQPGCKIREAKFAANNFVDQLVTGSGITKVGFAAYTGCYNPALNNAACVPRPGDPLTAGNCNLVGAFQVACLNAAVANTHTIINNMQPNGSTNICLGLKQGQKILAGPGNQSADPSTKRFIVLLTDGQNEWDASTAAGVDAGCVPAGVSGGPTACNSTRVANDINSDLDVKTLQLATVLKANTEIFTVQVYDSTCVPPNTTYTPAQCNNQVGNTDPVRIASARLLQCVASSTLGTNDHYFKTNNAATLGDIFTQVAYEIASRGLTVSGPP